MELFQINTLSETWIERFPGGAATRRLGGAAGSGKLYVNVDTVPPGAYSAKYHAHTAQEEFFLILRGTGTLRTPEGERPVGPGEFCAKPCGPEHAHTFYNSGCEALVILDVGTVERGDVCLYPDEGVYYLRDQGLVFRGPDRLEGWTSGPDPS